MERREYATDPETGAPMIFECPKCRSNEDLLVQELAPGTTWALTCGVCGRFEFLGRA